MSSEAHDPIRILIVDDKADYRETKAELLRDFYGYLVETAANSDQALGLARQVAFHVALIDHVLSGDNLDGIELMEALRAEHPALEFILLTGYGLDPQAKALQAGAYRFVEKRIDNDALHQMIALCVEAGRARGELELLRREHKLLENLQQLGRAIGATLEQETILQAIYDHLGRWMDVENIDIVLLDKKWGELEFVLSYSEGQPEECRRRLFSFTEDGPGLMDWVIRHQAPFLIRDYPLEPLPVQPYWHPGPEIRSWLGAPMLVGDFTIGAISLQNERPNRYDTTDQRSLMAVANLAAQALFNARLYAERQVLNAISERIMAVEAVDRLLKDIASELGPLIDTRNLRIGLYRPDRESIDLVVRYDDGQHLPPYTLGLRQTLLSVSIRSGRPLLLRSQNEVASTTGQAEIDPQGGQPRSWLSAPLIAGNEKVIGAIAVQDYSREGAFDEHDRELLVRLANLLAVAVSRAQLLEQVQLGLRQRETLSAITLHLQTECSCDPERGLWAFLTGVTAGYGLGLNRAALFRWEPDPERPGERGVLSGWLAIGDLDSAAAGRTWADMQSRKLDSLEASFHLSIEELADKPLNQALAGQQIAVANGSEDPFSRAVFQREPSVLDGRAYAPSVQAKGPIGQAFWQAFDPGEFAVVPLQRGGRLEGVLAVDNKFTHAPIDAGQMALLAAFAEATLVVIDHLRLQQELERRVRVLEKHYQLITALRFLPRREDSLRLLLATLKELYDLDTCTFGRLSEDGLRLEFDPQFAIGLPELVSLPVERIPVETWGLLKGSDTPQVFPDLAEAPQIRALLVLRDLRSLAVTPVRGREGRLWGVLTLGRRGETTITPDDLETLQALAGQAALALRNAELFEEVRLRNEEVRLRNRAQELLLKLGRRLTGAVADPLKDLLDEIVRGAQELVHADNVVIYPFLEKGQRYNPRHFAAVGLFSDKQPTSKRRTDRSLSRIVLRSTEKMLVVDDVTDQTDRYGRVSIYIRPGDFIDREGVRSFVGVSLVVDDEPVGVLFVNFCQPHNFSKLELDVIQEFAAQAAVVIKKDTLMGQVSGLLSSRLSVIDGLRQAERLIGQLKPLEEVWEVILHTAVEATGAGWGWFLVVDEANGQLIPQAMFHVPSGGAEPGQFSFVGGRGITGWVAERRRSARVGDVHRDRRYAAAVESTRSELAVPVLLGMERTLVGIIDLESDREYAFSAELQKLVEALAAAAAVALANADLYRRALKQQRVQEALLKAGQAISSASLDRQATLDCILEEAVDLTGIDGDRAHLGAVFIWDGTTLACSNIYPRNLTAGLKKQGLERTPLPGGVRTPDGEYRIGVAGRAAWERRVIYAEDVAKHPDYLKFSPETRSELAIPLLADERLVGVLNVESQSPGAFTPQDIDALQTLAAQAAIAILNAEAYERLDASLHELQQKKNELAESQAVALTGILGSSLAHDIQGYAAAIRNNAEEVVEKLDGQAIWPRLVDPLKETQEAAVRILEVAGKLEQALEEELDSLNLHTLLEERLASWQTRHRQAGVAWELELRPPAPVVRANRLLLAIALDNLVDNAVRAMEAVETRRLVINTRREGKWVELRLSDSGPGIPDEDQNKLFKERFPPRNGKKNSGQGLKIVQMLLERFSGEIELESSGPQGACFVLRLLAEESMRPSPEDHHGA